MTVLLSQRPLQDQCEPTPYDDLEALFLTDMGQSISDSFEDFDPQPIGVASLAQVHVGLHRDSKKRVAVKVCLSVHPSIRGLKYLRCLSQLQHPHLAEFCDVDMEMVEVTLGPYSSNV